MAAITRPIWMVVSHNSLPGYQNFGGVSPVVFNGVSLDSAIYSGPYRGTSHQVESAMNLDWAMTVLKNRLVWALLKRNLMPSDANMFASELNSLVGQKRRVVRRNGLRLCRILKSWLADSMNWSIVFEWPGTARVLSAGQAATDGAMPAGAVAVSPNQTTPQ